ncbi:MAG: hypothetical protein ACK5LC_13195 [Coprobacillaceae bacterium]
MYGRVRYGVDVKDATTGELLYSAMYDTPSATLEYIPTGSVNVVGYYTYENSSIRSNEISKKLGADVELGNIQYSVTYNGSPINGSISLASNGGSIDLAVTITRQNPDSVMSVNLNSATGANLQSYTFPQNSSTCNIKLTGEGTYSIVFTETYNGKIVTATYNVTVVA